MVILANVNPIFREKKVHLSILRAAWGSSLSDDERSRGYGAAGPRSNSPVTPHKATNEGSSGPFELHSWRCAEKQLFPEENSQVNWLGMPR